MVKQATDLRRCDLSFAGHLGTFPAGQRERDRLIVPRPTDFPLRSRLEMLIDPFDVTVLLFEGDAGPVVFNVTAAQREYHLGTIVIPVASPVLKK